MPIERRKESSVFPLAFFLSLALTFIADQITKFLILKALSVGESIPIIKGIFHLTLVHNFGIAFGLLKWAGPVPLWYRAVIALAAVIFFSIFYILRRTSRKEMPFGLILAGALGNIVDRLKYGYVVDFLDLRVWPVFNIADCAITIGAILLAIQFLKKPNVSSSL